MLKKVVLDKPKEIKKNIEFDDNNKPIELSYREQVNIVNNIYMDNELDKYKKVISDFKKKINSYKAQDIKKDRYDINTLITKEQLYEKLVASRLKCYYCGKEVKVIYTLVRDDFQWTLDRKDNNMGHSSENTVISCLKCNLQRRVTDCKKFDFTKKLRIKKENDL